MHRSCLLLADMCVLLYNVPALGSFSGRKLTAKLVSWGMVIHILVSCRRSPSVQPAYDLMASQDCFDNGRLLALRNVFPIELCVGALQQLTLRTIVLLMMIVVLDQVYLVRLNMPLTSLSKVFQPALCRYDWEIASHWHLSSCLTH